MNMIKVTHRNQGMVTHDVYFNTIEISQSVSQFEFYHAGSVDICKVRYMPGDTTIGRILFIPCGGAIEYNAPEHIELRAPSIGDKYYRFIVNNEYIVPFKIKLNPKK